MTHGNPAWRPMTAIPILDRTELQGLLDGGGPVFLVEALGPAYYADAHLPGAVNIPPDRVDRLAPDLLPDRDATIVVYCSGTCSNAEVTAGRLVELGYHDVRCFPAGKEDWVEAGLPVDRDP